MKNYRFLRFIKILTLGLIFITLLTYIVMSLWNWLIPELFNGPSVTFWQAGGLLILSKIFFWGFGHHNNHSEKKEFWKKKFEEKFCKMSPEEREDIRSRFKFKCGDSEEYNNQQ